MKSIIINKVTKEKKNNGISGEYYDFKNQSIFINKLFLKEDFEDSDILKQELFKKRSSYRSQDLKKERLTDNFITYDDIVEKLVISKLKCSYCRDNVLLLYKNKRDNNQWTLDRIDNDKEHTKENTVISCLKCNLQKRRRDDKKFRFTKQMNLIKIF